ncbi:membrane protein [Thalassotalea insulae]|uniref:Membrane protein n=1 Tax=Thalassotalea insulae TaxID=2056778 RepID=A0ABQ6GSA4_9GAMM|nr:DMT family transporter [Thalassotalea insulae]GLX78277.1 membrane protein [Thalassotalea insulae]
MPKLTIGLAMLLLIIGNNIAVLSDALIKNLPKDVAVYQFILYRQLSAIVLLIPFCIFSKNTHFFTGLKWHIVRGHIWLFGAVFMVIALSTLPLATVNALFYTAPILMLLLAMLFFKEKGTFSSILVAALGFIGVLIIVKPSHFSWAVLAAFIVALTMALNNLLVKKLPSHHNVFQTLLLTSLVGTPVALALVLWEGQAWSWPSLFIATSSNVFILTYAGICVWVYRYIEANKIAAAEYTGLIGAIAIGILWFNESPEPTMYLGSAMIVLPLIWLAKKEQSKQKIVNS